MVFKWKLKTKLLVLLCVIFSLYVFFQIMHPYPSLSKKQFGNPSSSSLVIFIVILTIILIRALMCKEYCVLENDVVKIYKGKECNKIKVSDITYLYKGYFSNKRIMHNRLTINTNVAYIVTRNKSIEINIGVRNDRNESLIDVLQMTYGKKLKDELF